MSSVRHAITYGATKRCRCFMELKAHMWVNCWSSCSIRNSAGSFYWRGFDKVFQELLLQRNQMSVRTVSRYYDDAAYSSHEAAY